MRYLTRDDGGHVPSILAYQGVLGAVACHVCYAEAYFEIGPAIVISAYMPGYLANY